MAQHHISSFVSHTQEVCGLEWSPGGRYLASGSNNNRVAVWDYNQIHQNSVLMSDPVQSDPVHCFNQHRAAVKVIYLLEPLKLHLHLIWPKN